MRTLSDVTAKQLAQSLPLLNKGAEEQLVIVVHNILHQANLVIKVDDVKLALTNNSLPSLNMLAAR